MIRIRILRSLLLFVIVAICQPAVHAGQVDLASVADGKADATLAIQKSIDRDRIAALPAGQYRITAPLRFESNQGLIGPGTLIVDFDTLKHDDHETDLSSDSNVALLAKGENLRFEGFTLRKKFIDGSYGIGILVESGSRNIIVRDVDISGYSARYGIHLVEVEDFEISNCFIHDFMFDADTDMIRDSPAGLRVTRSSRGVISNNRIMRIEVGAHGFESVSPLVPKYGRQGYQSDHMTIMQCKQVAITGNTMETSGEGIDMLLSSECTLTGNVIRDIFFQGIKMLGVSKCSLTGNQLSQCHQGIGLATHQGVQYECDYNTITGNTILFTDRSDSFTPADGKRKWVSGLSCGIQLDGTANHNLIVGNIIADLREKPVMDRAIVKNAEKSNVVENNLLKIGSQDTK